MAVGCGFYDFCVRYQDWAGKIQVTAPYLIREWGPWSWDSPYWSDVKWLDAKGQIVDRPYYPTPEDKAVMSADP